MPETVHEFLNTAKCVSYGCNRSGVLLPLFFHVKCLTMLCGVIRKSNYDEEDRYKLFCDDKGRRIRVSADCWIDKNPSFELELPAEVKVDNTNIYLACSLVDMVGKVRKW